jgi:hypothetical protein
MMSEGGTLSREGAIDYSYIMSMIDPDSEVIDIKTEHQLEEFVVLKAIKDV